MNEMRIYVASLSDYNNGRLEGKWFDLADYSNASELMEAIQEMLDDLTKKYNDGEVREEWAVHDYEGIPSTLASEYMSEQDFQQLYDIAEVADDRGIPVEVLVERAGDTGSDDYQALADSLMFVVDGYDESDIVAEYESQLGDLGSDFWSNHIYIGDVTERVLYGEDVDRFREDILSENPDMDEDEAERQAEEMADEEAERREDLTTYLEDMGYGDEIPSFVSKDYEGAWKRSLSYDFDVINHDGQMYVFSSNYSLGGTILSGMIGAYIGYKVGRAKPQKKGFSTEKRIGRKIKGALTKKKMARGGGVYSSDTMYELKVFDGKSNEFLTSVRYRARNQREANEIGQEYEYEMHQKYGDYLRFELSEAKPLMARGGNVNTGRSWHQDRRMHNKSESYEKPMAGRKRQFEEGGYVGYKVRSKNLRGGYNNYIITHFDKTSNKYFLRDSSKDLTTTATTKELKEMYEFVDKYAKGGGVGNYEMYDEQLYLDNDLKDAILENDTLSTFIKERHFIRDKNGKLFMWIDWMDYDQFDELANFLGYKYAKGGGVDSSNHFYFAWADVNYFDEEGEYKKYHTSNYIKAESKEKAKMIFLRHLENKIGQNEWEWQEEYIEINPANNIDESIKDRGYLSASDFGGLSKEKFSIDRFSKGGGVNVGKYIITAYDGKSAEFSLNKKGLKAKNATEVAYFNLDDADKFIEKHKSKYLNVSKFLIRERTFNDDVADYDDFVDRETYLNLKQQGRKMETGGGVDTIHIGTKIKSSSQTYVVTKKSTFGFVMEAKNGDKMIKDEYEIKQLIERGQLKIVNEEYSKGGGVDGKRTFSVYELAFGQPYNFYNEEENEFIWSEPTKATLYTKEEALNKREELLKPRRDYYQRTGNNYKEIHIGDLSQKKGFTLYAEGGGISGLNDLIRG